MQELKAVQTAIGLMVAVRAGEAKEVPRIWKYGPSKQKWPEEGSNSSLACLNVFQ